ncbi:Protein of unknown function (DUF179 [Striga hermonthica]|uniref:Uncharacterized protein n=1 Tax=Striga hermonthica TaxID=68872 RepID=A0A9N7MVV4_STRHE|nr:Protein of unknown function (DUF179 [Striga hermonthica]
MFRAKLVAGERALDPEAHTHGMIIPITDRWAHAIHEPEKGCLLIATEKLDGVHIFERTVVLLLSIGSVGPKGLILNRPSLMSIKEMRSALVGVSGPFSGRPLFFGGPLEDGLFLMGLRGTSAGFFDEVMEGLYYGTKESMGCAAEMVKRGAVGPGDFRFYDGYCAWEMGQLRDEIRAGYWTVAACSSSVIGLTGEESVGLWEEIMGLVGPRKVW